MKRTLLSLAVIALGALTTTLHAQDKKLVEMTGWSFYSNTYGQLPDGSWGYISEKLDEPTVYDHNYYYYNAKGELGVEQRSAQNFRYTYNADGSVATREQWANQGGVFYKSSVVTYAYDSEGNVTTETTESLNTAGEVTYTSAVNYSEYVNGEYGVMATEYYESHYRLEFNDAGQLTARIQLMQNAETGEWETPNTGDLYTYENGQLVKHVNAYYDASAEAGHEWETNVVSTETYTYNADGSIKTRLVVTDSRGMHSEVEWRYIYSSLDATAVPQNLTADGEILGNNEVYVKWDAVSGASSYIVMYDTNIAEVEGKTEFITPTLADGEHQVAVLAIVGGEQKNLSDFVKVSVKDAGNVPMQNFRVVKAEKVDIESYGYVSSYYNLTLEWEVPEGASTISDFKVYADTGTGWNASATYTQGMPEDEKLDSYNGVTSWVTDRQNFYWTTFENYVYDEDTWQSVSTGDGPDARIWICAVYATGESQPSNVVDVNIYDLANGGTGETAVEAISVSDETAPVEVYNLAGQRVQKVGSRQLQIVKQGNVVKKVLK